MIEYSNLYLSRIGIPSSSHKGVDSDVSIQGYHCIIQELEIFKSSGDMVLVAIF
jgi:hypothetical protein